jgi:hypothetical protein
VKLCRAGDRALQLLLFNEEFLVSASHQLALTTSLPFVHTARRYYRLNGSVRPSDWSREVGNGFFRCWKVGQTWSFRGSKSRNKVSVGEPAEGSLLKSSFKNLSIPHCLPYQVASTGQAGLLTGTSPLASTLKIDLLGSAGG